MLASSFVSLVVPADVRSASRLVPGSGDSCKAGSSEEHAAPPTSITASTSPARYILIYYSSTLLRKDAPRKVS